jgi:hypothetical protein
MKTSTPTPDLPMPRLGWDDWGGLMASADRLDDCQGHAFFSRLMEALDKEYDRRGHIDADDLMLAVDMAGEAAIAAKAHG